MSNRSLYDLKMHIAIRWSNHTLCGRTQNFNKIWTDSVFDYKWDWCLKCKQLFNTNHAGKRKLK